MDTLIKFKRKVFGKHGKVVEFLKTPSGIISTATLGVSGANLITNASRHKNDKLYQEKQIEAMNRLTKSINGLDNTVKTTKEQPSDKRILVTYRPKNYLDMIKFRQKQFGILSDTQKGAAIGGTVGTIATSIPYFSKGNNWSNKLAIIGGGTIIGAGLGLLVGITKEISKKTNRIATVDRRLMQHVVEVLKKTGFKEGNDFTRDPKIANDLKIKVCIIISKDANNLSLLVNTVSDSRLKTVAKEMMKNIPNTATVTTKLSDKYNDILISTISDSSANTGLIAGIAEYFIRHKYPVYLVEVG